MNDKKGKIKKNILFQELSIVSQAFTINKLIKKLIYKSKFEVQLLGFIVNFMIKIALVKLYNLFM